MGRKIYITSDMSTDEALMDVAAVNPMAPLLWPWLLTALDDWGRAEAGARQIKARVFPSFPAVTAEVVEDTLQACAEAGLIALYEANGKRYMAVNPAAWWKYQTHIRKEKRSVDTSKCPAPPADLERARDCAQLREDACNCDQVRASASECAQVAATASDFVPTPSPSPSPSVVSQVRPRAREGAWGDVVKAYEKYTGGLIGGVDADGLGEFFDKLDPPLILKAFELAAGRSRNFNYVAKMLERWAGRGFVSLADWEKDEMEQQTRGDKRKTKGGAADDGNVGGRDRGHRPYTEDDGYDWNGLAR